jgi:trimeric autotransporter adhesin
MKKSTLLLMLMQAAVISMYAQTTNFGTGSSISGVATSHFGYYAGGAGWDNSFFGFRSGAGNTGNYNIAIGNESLSLNSGGSWNSALGTSALHGNTTGSHNTSVGGFSLYSNTTGFENTATGASSLPFNRTGYQNTANGYFSLGSNTTGYLNTANGHYALLSNQTGHHNVAVGNSALFKSTTGGYNVACGGEAMYNNTSGYYNAATGFHALHRNTTGQVNSAFGSYALVTNTTGFFNSAFGHSAGPTGSDFNNTTALGSWAKATATNAVRIGNTAVTSIGGQVSWSTLSDGRFKTDLKEDVAGLEFINKLRPVSYSVDKEALNKFLEIPDSVSQLLAKYGDKNARQNGFVAQEVEEVIKKEGYVFHGIEAPQNEKDHYGIRYAEFVVPLVKAVQELTAKLGLQEKLAEEQKKEMDVLKQQLKLSGAPTVDEINSKTEVGLYQNNPNPFTVATEIGMSLPESTGQATLIIYNMEGKQLKVIPINDRGKTVVKIEGNELKAGMYFYSLLVDGKVLDTKRMILTSY